ncbi:putative UBP1-associated protein [Cocos nucifera]|uniref:Putative UBP1-associated protein n=1 Tax=Cocos nucifera TaxID=13894 RepID=A0A8K0I9K3_COCNU|nr:putative UBP1-associated protein [Cocos nucifera]
MVESVKANGFKKADESKERDTLKDTGALVTGGEKESMTGKKRKVDASCEGLAKTTEDKNVCNLSNGEVLQTEKEDGQQCQPKKKKHANAPSNRKQPEDEQRLMNFVVSFGTVSSANPPYFCVFNSHPWFANAGERLRVRSLICFEMRFSFSIPEIIIFINPDGVMKIRKLQKLVIKALKESGISEDEAQLRDTLMGKIDSSSRFVIEDKHIRLVARTQAS